MLINRASALGVDGVLREVVDSDLDAFFEHQREPEANRMAAFPARDREAFDAHWRRLLADDSLTKKTIVYEGEVACNVGCWEQEAVCALDRRASLRQGDGVPGAWSRSA